jgi:hypothetical protein
VALALPRNLVKLTKLDHIAVITELYREDGMHISLADHCEKPGHEVQLMPARHCRLTLSHSPRRLRCLPPPNRSPRDLDLCSQTNVPLVPIGIPWRVQGMRDRAKTRSYDAHYAQCPVVAEIDITKCQVEAPRLS